MQRDEKDQVIRELRGELVGAASIVLTDFTGLEVEMVNKLRRELGKEGVKCRVAKNTLIRLAVEGSKAEAMVPLLAGPTVLIWHDEEPAIGAKILRDFIKDLGPANDKLAFKGGYIDGTALKGDEAKSIADMLSKDELRAQILGLVKQVPGKFLALLNTPARNFLGVLKAREEDLEKNA